jgi:PAS domain-containing protein
MWPGIITHKLVLSQTLTVLLIFLDGFYNAPFDTTRETINNRRMHTLRYLGESLNATRTVKDFWKRILDGLDHNHYDVPLALMYSVVEADGTGATSQSCDSTHFPRFCLLEGTIGIPTGHAAASPKLDLTSSQEGFIPALKKAMRTLEPTMLSKRDNSLPAPLLKDIKCRGFEDPCKEAAVFPLRPPNGSSVFAFLLLGINPRKSIDDDYKTFITMLHRQLETSLTSVILFEEEVRRSKEAAETAARQEEKLLKQLELQTSRMRRMTELSPLGMYLFDPKGVLVEANEKYMEMTGFRKGDTRKEWPRGVKVSHARCGTK